MTTKEFVKKESEKIANKAFPPESEWSETKLLVYNEFKNGAINGLSKGLEIAKEFLKWADYRGWERYEVGGDSWLLFSNNSRIVYTSELLEIFLTEKENNHDK